MCAVAAVRLASHGADSTPVTPPTGSTATAPTGDGYMPSYHFLLEEDHDKSGFLASIRKYSIEAK